MTGQHEHRDFAARCWDERACAPLLPGGARVAAAHARLQTLAGQMGYVLTDDPDLRVIADGVPRAVSAAAHGDWRVMLPAGTSSVRILSRSLVPQHQDPGLDDRRRLGLAVTGLAIGGRAVPLTHPMLAAGFHSLERNVRMRWRWTDGDARLHVSAPWDRAMSLRLRAAPWPRYWLASHGVPQQPRRVA